MSIRTQKMTEKELINAKNLIALEIKERTNALSLVDRIIQVVKNFDNKVFNVRFERALEQVDSNVSLRRGDIVYRYHNRHVLEHKNNESDYACAIYVQYDSVLLTNLWNTDAYKDNRINASVIVESLEKVKLQEQEHIDILKKNKNKLEQFDNKYIELLTKLRAYIDSVDYHTRAYLHISQIF